MAFLLSAVLMLLLLLGYLGYRYEKRAGRSDFERLSPPGMRIQVGRHCLYILAMGERQPGQPLVVLEAGHGDWSRVWGAIQPRLAEFARVVAYDRAGFGWSDPGPVPRTPLRVVAELRELLERAGEPPPYLLVGHSMGGPFTRLFYSLYSQDVAGMVWVDSAHEELPRFMPFWKAALRCFLILARLGALLSRLGLVRLAGQPLMRAAYPSTRDPLGQAAMFAQVAPPKFFNAMIDETLQMFRSESWSHTMASLGDLPVTSIEAQYPPGSPPGYPPRQWAEFLAGWRAIHEDLSRLSTHIRRVPAPTGHMVMFEQPELVVQSVRELLNELSTPVTPQEV
jgi:pimeloyl-ACP methyl ester carboxylesterase